MDKIGTRYSLPNRLDDVIALISVLAQGRDAFMSEQGIRDSLRGTPKSKKSELALTWQDIVTDHHEFFRPNGANDFFALVIRSYFPEVQDPRFPDNPNAKVRPTLTVDETQNLINVAVSLHEKELDRLQKNSFKVPIIVAIISLVGVLATVSGVIYTSYHSSQTNNITNQKIDSLKGEIQQSNKLIKSIQDIDNRNIAKWDSNMVVEKRKTASQQ